MDWNEPRPPAPSELEASVGEWLEIIEMECGYETAEGYVSGWDSEDCQLIATQGTSWEPGIPMRLMAVQLVDKGGLRDFQICSTHLYDEGSRV